MILLSFLLSTLTTLPSVGLALILWQNIESEGKVGRWDGVGLCWCV